MAKRVIPGVTKEPPPRKGSGGYVPPKAPPPKAKEPKTFREKCEDFNTKMEYYGRVAVALLAVIVAGAKILAILYILDLVLTFFSKPM